MNPGSLLLAVVAPMVCGLLLPDGPRAYYVTQALLVAVLLWKMPGGASLRLVRWLGICIQLVAAAYGVFADSGAVEWPVVLALLVVVCVVAEAVLQMEAWRCRRTTT